jgi:CheY-like chemotaxis protein
MWEFGPDSPRSGLRILVIDDDPAVRELLYDVLAGEGYSVKTADCGEAAVRLFREDPFKLVVLDIRMPGMGGLEVLRQLKRADPSVFVVMITGYPVDQNAGEAMREGAQAIFHKPLNFPAFLPFLLSLQTSNSSAVFSVGRRELLN